MSAPPQRRPRAASADVAASAIRIRRDVWSLEPWDDVLLWYSRAVERMQQRPPSDPTSWAYQAAIHGLDPPGQDPQFWDQCQHQTWHFLPWHRGYLNWFERIVQATIGELDGPHTGWALPYWNYSDAANPNGRLLPPAFRDQHRPDGHANPLFVPDRRSAVNHGAPIGPARDVSVAALDISRFEADPHGASGGFGGPRTGFNHGGGRFGELEATPHGLVHVDIGGLMADPATAALDPIFWVHHANIDRLWEVWRQRSGHNNPTASSWLNLRFKLHDAQKRVVTFRAAQMLDTTHPPLSYKYDSVADPRGAAAPPAVAPGLPMTPPEADDTIPEMVGASGAVELGGAPTTATVKVEPPTGPAAAAPEAKRVFVNLENVVGARAATNYDVYVNLPEGADPAEHADKLAGVLPTFGIQRASSRDDERGGGGLQTAFDITDLANRQREEGHWDPRALRVTFVPREASADAPPLTVGRVSVYYK